jgi:YYY domain-containing protein
MLIRVTSVSSTVAFNLMIALLFGLVAVSAYGLLNNLLAKKSEQEDGKEFCPLWGVLASIFILIISNMQGFLEMLHAKGIGWTQLPDGSWSSRFWTWLQIPEVENPPSLPLQWMPNRSGGYWWWRASRVVQDFKATGEQIEVIDEFPQFSYLLADMHPHDLSMPFVLLAVTVALNIYLGAVKNGEGKFNIVEWIREKLVPSTDRDVKFGDLFVAEWLKEPVFWLMALVCGGISFFNTWDFPVYVGIFCIAVLVFNTAKFGWSRKRVSEFLETGILTGLLSILLYLPFFLSFDSQAGGLLPSLNFFTRGVYFWIMFGTLLVPLLIWMIWLAVKKRGTFHPVVGRWGAFGLVFGFWGVSYLIAALFLVMAPNVASEAFSGLVARFYWLQGGLNASSMLVGSLLERLKWPMTWVTLLIGLYLAWGLLFDRPQHPEKNTFKSTGSTDIDRFVIILILAGLGLTLFPEFLYLLDQFGTRMNTIFKFYFQTWILWGVAASYATVMIWTKTKGFVGVVLKGVSALFILIGLAYPVFGIWEITDQFSPKTYDATGNLVPDWTLDGASYRERNNPDEMAAIHWLKTQPVGVVAEAVGDAYSDFARVSTYSGQPTVLGWPNHESQWRGGYEEMGSRETDIETLYRTSDWNAVQSILDTYQIDYVFFGNLEVGKYNASNKVFEAHLTKVFEQGDVIIYQYSPGE